MASGYSRSPKLIKGALIRFSDTALVPIPNIIVFQYNPEALKRSFSPCASAPAIAGACPPDLKQDEPLTQPYDPQETFDLSLDLDAADALEAPASHPVAVVSGVADRIAAIEMLLYPPGETLVGSLQSSISASISAVIGAKKDIVPHSTVPVVLLFFGPGRIVPVRITSFSVDEQAFSPLLYPIRATVTLGIKVLDANAFDAKDTSASVNLARACYRFTRAQKNALALANMANSAESIMGMLPI